LANNQIQPGAQVKKCREILKIAAAAAVVFAPSYFRTGLPIIPVDSFAFLVSF